MKFSNNVEKWKSNAKWFCYKKKFKNAFGAIDTASTVHAVALTPHAKYDNDCAIDERFVEIEYLREFESEFKKARESGAHWIVWWEKNPGDKNLVKLYL
jgi:hypothetical protein